MGATTSSARRAVAALTDGTNGDQVGVASPGLDSGLKNNGGPTQTIALLAGSPAIDAGNSALTTDQRGYKRPLDGNAMACHGRHRRVRV